jgi:phage-related protein
MENSIIGTIIFAVAAIFIVGRILKSKGVQTEWGRFKPFSMKFWIGLAAVLVGYMWAVAQETFSFLWNL